MYKKIKAVSNYPDMSDTIKDEEVNINYLEHFGFSKSLKTMKKKLKDKSVVIYGAGVFFQVIQRYYDLSGINIIGISDKRFDEHGKEETCLGYKVYAPNELRELNPDYVIVATKNFISIIEDLYYDTLKGTKIKIKPIYNKGLINLIKDIWF